MNQVSAQLKTVAVHGKVLSECGEKIEFASIVEDGTDNFTSTDNNGAFTLGVQVGKKDSLVAIKASFVGKQSLVKQIFLKRDTSILFVLRDNTLDLDSVQLVAYRAKSRSNSSIVFNRETIEQLQAFSLADIINQLPGKATTAPNLQERQTAAFRTNSTGLNAINNSFGIAIFIDGVRVSNDANMQNLSIANFGIAGSAVKSYATGNSGNFDVAMNGLDLRDISLSNIESIEIAQGVVSSQYGELSNGAIFIELRKGYTPYTINVGINGGSTQTSINKGFQLPRNAGALNVDFSYLYSNNDPRDKVKSYGRANGSVMWTKNLSANLSHSLSVGYNRRLDNVKADPDDDEYRTMRTISYGYNIAERLNWQLNGIVEKVNFNAQYSNSKQDSWNEYLLNYGPTPYTTKDTNGIYEGYILQGSYVAQERVIGQPITLNANLNVSFKKFTSVLGVHSINAGANYSLSGNHGAGVVADPNKPRWAANSTYENARPYSYNYLPDLVSYAFYAEDNISGQFLGRKYNLTLGLRGDVQNAWLSYNPRTSFNYCINDHWSVNLAYGLSSKGPSMAHRYPAPSWVDIPLLTLINTSNIDSSVYLVYTQKIIADNSNLKASRSAQIEFGLQYKDRVITSSLYGYVKKNSNGFNSTQVYSPVTLPVYSYTLLSDPLRKAQYYQTGDYITYNAASRYVVSNGLFTSDMGLEWMMQIKEIRSIRTSFATSTALSYSTYDDRGDNETLAIDQSYIQQGKPALYAVYRANKSSAWSALTKLSSTTHIPKLGFVLSLQSDIHWQEATKIDETASIPMGYIDKNLVYHPITDFDVNDPDMAYLRRNSVALSKTKLPFVYANLNMQLAKEIQKKLRITVNIYNLFNIRPQYFNPATDNRVTYNDPISITAGIMIKL